MSQNSGFRVLLVGLLFQLAFATKICNIQPSLCASFLNCDSDSCFSGCNGPDNQYYGSPNFSPIWCITCVSPQICSNWTVTGCSNGALLFRNEFCCLANCAICNQTECLNCISPNAQYINGFGCTDCTSNQICQNSRLVECIHGYYLNGNNCIQCPVGCVACNAGGGCLTTICSSTSYYINNAACQLCSVPRICLNYYLTSCLPNNAYYLSNNSWLACGGQKLCSNCSMIGCSGAFYLSGNTCTACYSGVCATCSSRYYCSRCVTNYSLYLNQYCCHDTCAQCSYSACHRCISPSSQYINGDMCIDCFSPLICQNSELVSCDDGYELSGSTCVPCSSCAQMLCPNSATTQYVFESGTCTICDTAMVCINDQITGCVSDTDYYLEHNLCVYCTLPRICSNSMVVSCQGPHYLLGSNCFGCYSPQCATCSSQFYCSTCPSPLYTYQQNQFCCAPNCLICNHRTCDACVDGTQYYAYGPNCIPCISQICSQSVVIGCIQGYYLTNYTCIQCKPDCIRCTSTACLECSSLTQFYIQGKYCLTCLTRICVNNQLTPTCISGYYYLSSNCYQCPIQCPTCTSISCQTCISPCLTCSLSTCLTCINNNQYVSSITTCTNCPSQCLTCTSTQCTTCLPPCSTCDHTQCLSCVSSNYYIQGTQCLICGQFCATCTAAICLSCIYSNQYIQGANCINCPVWCSTCTASQCLTCQSPCLTCSITGCLSCISDQYQIDNNHTCINCGQNCLNCNQNQCLTCLYSNQYISQHNCITCPSHCSLCDSQTCTGCLGSCATCNLIGCLTCIQQNQYPLHDSCLNCPNQCLTCDQYNCLTCAPPCSTCDLNGCITCLIDTIKFTTPEGQQIQSCQYPECDGFVWEYGQQCNDGNSNSNDGCTECKIDEGYTCQNYHNQASICLPLPFNCTQGNIIDNNVICITCDIGHYLNQNECQQCPSECLTCNKEKCLTCRFPSIDTQLCQICEIQIGYYSNKITNECFTQCGDGITAGIEQCDDANDQSRDGCTHCQIESGWFLDGSVFEPIIYPIPSISQEFTLELYNNTRTFKINYNIPISQIEIDQLVQIQFQKQFNIQWIQANDTQSFIFNIHLQESCVNQSLLIKFTNVSTIVSQLNFNQQLQSLSIIISDYIQVSQQTKDLTETSQRVVDYLLIIIAIIALFALFFGGLECLWNLLDLLQIISYLQYINTVKPYNLDEFIRLFSFIQLQNIMDNNNLEKNFISFDSKSTPPYLIAQDDIICSTSFNIVPLLIPWFISYMTFYLSKLITLLSYEIDVQLSNTDSSRSFKVKFILVQCLHFINNICYTIEQTFVYGGILITFQSSAYDFCFAIILGLYDFNTNYTDQVLTLFMVFIYFVSLGAITSINSLNKVTLNNQQRQYARLLEGIKLTNAGFYFSSCILFKKFLFMVFLVLLYSSPMHQALCIAFLSITQILYLLVFSPLINKIENIKQIICEILLFFTELQLSILVIDDQRKYMTYEERDLIGWSIICSILLLMIFQMIFDIIQQIPVYRKIYHNIRKYIERHSSTRNKQTTDLFI